MSTLTTLRIKPGLRWFPVGTEWQTLLIQLSDGAFKLFVYLCLNAQQATGQLEFHQTDLARALGKSRRSISAYLQELQGRHVCRVDLGRNQYAGGTIQIDPQYWPYEPAQPELASSYPKLSGADRLCALDRDLSAISLVCALPILGDGSSVGRTLVSSGSGAVARRRGDSLRLRSQIYLLAQQWSVRADNEFALLRVGDC